jgi:hypothetical protein
MMVMMVLESGGTGHGIILPQDRSSVKSPAKKIASWDESCGVRAGVAPHGLRPGRVNPRAGRGEPQRDASIASSP